MLWVAGTRRGFQKREDLENVAAPLGGNSIEQGLHAPRPGLAQTSRGISAGAGQGDSDTASIVADDVPLDPPSVDQVGDKPAHRALRETQALGEVTLPQRTRAQLAQRVRLGDAGIESAGSAFGAMQPEPSDELHDGIREPLRIGHSTKPTTR
jgi:hypothetical protein